MNVSRRALILTAAALAGARALPLAALAQQGTPMPGGMGHGDGPMGGTGAAFMTIANAGAGPDRLLSIAGDAAETIEIHEMADEGGMMTMRPLAGGLEIPAGETVELKPGGYHVMMIGLRNDLNAGDSHELTLTFEKAGEVKVTVPVMTQADAANLASAPVTAGDLTIDLAWSRPAPAMGGGGMGAGAGMATPMAGMGAEGGTGAVFMTIANAGAEPDRLTGGMTDVAEAVEIHEMAEEGGAMVMRPVEGGLEVPAGGSVELKPGGYHIMLIGLTKDLMADDIYELTLAFEKAGEVKIEVPVMHQRDAATKAAPAVVAGDLTIDRAWTRPAPALMGMGQGLGQKKQHGMDAGMAATPAP